MKKKMRVPPPPLGFVAAPIVFGVLVLGPCFVMQYFVLVFAFISQGKRELVALLLLCSECHVIVFVL